MPETLNCINKFDVLDIQQLPQKLIFCSRRYQTRNPEPTSMNKVVRIQQVLDELYPNPPVPLNNINDFTFLVAVVLSAQTTDGKVNDVTRELFKYATTPLEMSKLDVNFILNIIQPVGLAPQKSKYVLELSRRLVEVFDSKVPNTYAELESLSGVGHKTASVIMSQIFNIPSIAVDTHVHRLALRWGLSKDQKNVNNVQKDLCKLFPEESWNKVIPKIYLLISFSLLMQLLLRILIFRNFVPAAASANDLLRS